MSCSPLVRVLACWLIVCTGCARSNLLRDLRESIVFGQNPSTPPSRQSVPVVPTDVTERRLDQPGDRPSPQGQLRGYQSPDNNVDMGCSLGEAIACALRNSKVVRITGGAGARATAANVTGYDVEAQQAQIQAALAAFDATASAYFQGARFRQPPNAFFGPGLAEPLLRDEMLYGVGVTKPFITGGSTSLFYDPLPSYLYLPDGSSGFNPTHVSALTLGLRQPLLKGAGIAVNSVPIQVAQIQSEQTAWDFKQEVMETCYDVATAYWELHALRASLRAVNEMLPLLEETAALQQKLFEAERVIEADVGKAYSQLHAFRQERARLKSDVMQKELLLRNLLGLPPSDGLNLIPISPPTSELVEIDAELALQQALIHHPNLARQRLNVLIREKELVVAHNNMLPQFDFDALFRLNGLGEDLGSALSQMATADYNDWQLGTTFSVPLGRRQASARLHAVELKMARERVLLEQEKLSRAHDLRDVLRKIFLDHEQYREARLRLVSSEKWLQGARIRYLNPLPDEDRQNLLLQYINDYLAAMRFRTEAAKDVETLLAKYNADLVELEKVKGTILIQFGVTLAYDPCRQLRAVENPAPTSAARPPAAPEPAKPSLASQPSPPLVPPAATPTPTPTPTSTPTSASTPASTRGKTIPTPAPASHRPAEPTPPTTWRSERLDAAVEGGLVRLPPI